MAIWTTEIKELVRLYDSFKGRFPELEKELERLLKTDDENIILVYSRRCLEVLITDLCENELKRPRKTEPLKGVIDKLNKEEKVPSNIITSMDHLNSLSAYGAHPKDFDPEQVRPVLVNLSIILNWYSKYKDLQVSGKVKEAQSKTKRKIDSPPDKSIIVLPFENMSPDPDQEYFSDGLTEEIITDLSHIHDLLVISRSSAMVFKGTKISIKEIAKKVNVRYVLEGSVRKAANNLRIMAQLIDALTDTHIWAEKYSGTLDDVFDIQEKVSSSITESLRINISADERKITQSHTAIDSYAYECLLKARHEIWLGEEYSIKRAIGYLNEALRKVGENVEILSAQAEANYMLPHVTGEGFESAIEIVEKNADKILKIDPESSYGYLYRGLAYTKKDWGFRQAAKSLKYAFDLNQKDITTLLMISSVFVEAGYPDKAIFYSDRLLEIDPITPVNKLNRAFILLFLGHNESSKRFLKEVLSIDPRNTYYGGFAAVFFANMGENEGFLKIIKELKSSPIDNFSRMGLLYDYALHGNEKGLAKILIPEFKQTAKWDETLSWTLAQCFACVNNFNESLYWLGNAVKRGFTNYPYLNDHDPFLRKLHGEERFKKLMERVKYEWENFEV